MYYSISAKALYLFYFAHDLKVVAIEMHCKCRCYKRVTNHKKAPDQRPGAKTK